MKQYQGVLLETPKQDQTEQISYHLTHAITRDLWRLLEFDYSDVSGIDEKALRELILEELHYFYDMSKM